MKAGIKFVAAAVIALFCMGVFAATFLSREPLVALARPERGLTADPKTPLFQNGRRIEHITLQSKKLGDISFALSLPESMPEGKLPVLFVMGGLKYGKDNIAVLKEPGANAIIGYDWPIPVHFPEGADFLFQAPALYRQVLSIPAQGASILRWAADQPWADKARISVLGFSLGALVAPALQNVAAADGTTIGWTVLAYGGAPLTALFDANPFIRPSWLRPVMRPAISFLLGPLEPSLHLPRLSGQFLVIEGQNDTLIPESARALMRDLTPEPKTVITLEGPHMGLNHMALLQQIICVCTAWLEEKGAANK